jgi:hypothetical protein
VKHKRCPGADLISLLAERWGTERYEMNSYLSATHLSAISPATDYRLQNALDNWELK